MTAAVAVGDLPCKLLYLKKPIETLVKTSCIGTHPERGVRMKLKMLILSLSLLLVAAVFSPCFAAVEWSVQNRLQMEAPPVDVTVSLNDKWDTY